MDESIARRYKIQKSFGFDKEDFEILTLFFTDYQVFCNMYTEYNFSCVFITESYINKNKRKKIFLNK